MNDPRIQALYDQLQTILLVLSRPVVQRQLAAFLIVFLIAWLVPVPFSMLLRRAERRDGKNERDENIARLRSWRARFLRLARAIQYVLFPTLGLLLSHLVIGWLDAQGWRSGLLKQFIPLFWLLLAYQVLVGILYAVLAPETAQSYHRRFVTPLFLILVVISLNTGLAGTFPIGDIELVQLMGVPVTLKSLIAAAIVFYLFLALAWILRDMLEGFVLPRTQADPGIANTILVTSHYVIIALGFLTAVGALGFNLSALAIIGGGLSVGIGFGLQELVANFVSGILLLFEQTLRPGDVIEVSGQRGTVSQLRMRATVLRTIDNVEVIVPNKTLLTSSVATYTHTNRVVRRIIDVGVGYDSDPTEVRDILLSVAKNHGSVLKDPEPVVFFIGFGDSSLDFQVAVWVGDPSRMLAIVSDLHFMIFREFTKHKIEIPFPQRDLHLRSSDIALGPTIKQNGNQMQPVEKSLKPEPLSKPKLP